MLSIRSVALVAAVVVVSSVTPVAAMSVQQPASSLQNQQEIQPIDLNTATAEQLQAVPGIGEALAKRIIDFRQEHGPFEKVDDLLNVRGIGIASLEKLRPFFTVKKSD